MVFVLLALNLNVPAKAENITADPLNEMRATITPSDSLIITYPMLTSAGEISKFIYRFYLNETSSCYSNATCVKLGYEYFDQVWTPDGIKLQKQTGTTANSH